MDFCCGTTMSLRFASLTTDGGAQIADVPFLYCHSCGHTVVAPEVELDVTMYTHYCDTDGVKQATLHDVVNKEKLQHIAAQYPAFTGPSHLTVSEEQIDHMLDVWNFAKQIDDQEWLAEIKLSLVKLHKVRQDSQLLQPQS
ncbi:MAG: hypothetical protein OWR52_01150 [Acidibacillus sp.]|uniref:Uncharacterized protein n=1 Tax=Sulfoacidibacillus ferrooxidans TaxID=2005001 RepID=A0A9X1V932_9BACL|nr:hypothetical protein [Sulfoacidibacillus ferrooxidans]MCI0183573.1 hypothetical protein [Sulfoacidibacillus ferrooxidans]MCY0892105.1 hypothetical protein [Acidibacillus sp.]